MKELLLVPGPAQVPGDVRAEAARPPINHRSQAFRQLHQRLQQGLQTVLETRAPVILLPAAGTGALEALIVNLLSPGEHVLAVTCGAFGERWAEIATAYGLDVKRLRCPWGEAPDPEQLRAALAADRDRQIRAVLLTHNETSTGVQTDVQTLAGIVRAHGALVLVDSVSGAPGAPLQIDAWGVDAVALASQKCFMTPPGLALVVLGERARTALETAKLPRFYWDLRPYLKSAVKGETPYTPAVTLWFALERAVTRILEEGLPAFQARHARLAALTRTLARDLGFTPLAHEGVASPTVTALRPPSGHDADALRKRLAQTGILVAGGQGELAGKILRIAHMGPVTEEQIRRTFSALDQILRDAPASVPACPVRPHVVVAEPIAAAGIRLLERHAQVTLASGAELAPALATADALIVRSGTRVSEELLAQAPQLKVVARAGSGLDNVDGEACERRRIRVVNTPDANTIAAAEHTFALMLALARRIPQAHASLLAGRWDRHRFGGAQLADKTLGLIGFGRIGRAVAARAIGFSMHVLAFDPLVEETDGLAKLVDLDTLLASSDIVSLHAPLTPATRNLVDADKLLKMRPGAWLINCARGGLVDEEALAEALQSGRLRGAAVDVFATEPTPPRPWFNLPNVVVTPHLGASTAEAQETAARDAALALLQQLGIAGGDHVA